MDEYDLFFISLKDPFDILIFTETWLNSDNANNCKFEGYKPIHLLRPVDNHVDFKNIGGGVSIFIRNNINFKPRKDLNIILPFMECSFVEVNFNNKTNHC